MTRSTSKKPDRNSQPSLEIGWQVVEEVADLLEKSLTPYAKVEHNVRLQAIGKTRRRQCDVVITFGEPPRQTRTIVEVQKRGKKPEINAFHGWYHKMTEVGAQNLICVSTKGFPKSIIDEVATRYGPTIRLLTLEQLRETKAVRLGSNYLYFLLKHQTFRVEKKGSVDYEGDTHERDWVVHDDDKIFLLDTSQELVSQKDLIPTLIHEINQIIRENDKTEFKSFSLEINLASLGHDLWVQLEGQRYKISKYLLELKIETKVSQIPFTVLVYKQQFIDGVLAWVALVKYTDNGKEKSFQVVFKPNKEGILELTSEPPDVPRVVYSHAKADEELYYGEKLSIFMKEAQNLAQDDKGIAANGCG